MFGGPRRGRTYGPLIKSERQGVAQVLDDWAIPFFGGSNSEDVSQFSLLPVSPFQADLSLFLTK
jgi:hypothetical protein